jgi:hypothetical protein
VRALIATGAATRAAIVTMALVLIFASPAAAGQLTLTFDDGGGPGCSAGFALGGGPLFGYSPGCLGTPLGFQGGGSQFTGGMRIAWQSTAPSGITINDALVQLYDVVNINNNEGWGGGSYYAGRAGLWHNGDVEESDLGLRTSYWGFAMICGWAHCTNYGAIDATAITLVATENQGPGLLALGSNNLWYQGPHWVWNPSGDRWPIALFSSDPSGVCDMWAVVNGQVIQGPAAAPNTAVWQQCPDPTWSTAGGATVDTRDYVGGAGRLALELDGVNAAGVDSRVAETLNVDNEPVQLSVSGPSTASTTAGVQYIVATASAGPSGVAIGCSVDAGPEQWHNGSVDEVPVAGAGDHVVSCQAHNGAIDPQGQYAYSAPESWSLDIGQPTVSAIGFEKIVDPLRCGRARQRVRVPAQWVIVRRHGKAVKVRRRAHTKIVTVERCHPRVVWERKTVWVSVVRHGKRSSVKRTERVRVVLIPHTVLQTKKQVPYGDGTTVSGWLGTASGIALGSVPVQILTAPNNGQGQFSTAAWTTTRADGSWTARLSSGPSRLIEAAYGGSAGLLPVTSPPIELNVPARITLAVTPRTLPWSGTVTVRGHLDGGHVPPDGVALRLLIAVPHRSRPYEPVPFRTDGHGSFAVRWSWGTGSGVATYPFAVATTATESDYPFAASQSRWIPVMFGLPTPAAADGGGRRRRVR